MSRNLVFILGTRYGRGIPPDLLCSVSPRYEALLRHELDLFLILLG